MEKEKRPIAAGMAGLIGVRVGHIYYAGKVDRKKTEAVKKKLGKDFVVLNDAFELLISHRATEEGVQVNIIPTWIAPHNGLVQGLETRADTFLDLSSVDDKGFLSMVRAMGGTGILIPGLGGPLAPGLR